MQLPGVGRVGMMVRLPLQYALANKSPVSGYLIKTCVASFEFVTILEALNSQIRRNAAEGAEAYAGPVSSVT